MGRRAALLIVLVGLAFGLVSSVQPARALGRDETQIVLRAAVKLMTPFDADPNGGSLCSGTMLNQEGYILTNYHCIGYVTSGERDRSLESLGLRPGDLYNRKGLALVAITDNPRQLPVPTYVAQLLTGDSDLDLAVLKVISYYNSKQQLQLPLPVTSVPIADSDAVNVLDEIFVIGYPGIAGDTVTATEGKISGYVLQDDGTVDWIKTDVLVNQGNSGGSAINGNGELIGVPTARLQDQAGNVIYLVRPVNFAVPYIQQALKAGGSHSDISTTPTTPVTPPAVPSGQNFGRITFGSGFNEATGVTGAATRFQSGVAEVHAGLPYADMRDGTAWGFVWQFDGKDVTGQPSLKWSFGSSGILDLYLKGNDTLSDGTYNLQVSLRGELAQEAQFAVGSSSAAMTPQKPPQETDTGVLITGSIIDQSTRRPIPGAIIVFLYPDKTVYDFDVDDSKGKVDTALSYGVADAGGEFTINVPLPRGQVYSVIAGAKGYQRIAEDNALEITEDDLDLIELDPIELDRQ